MLHNIQRLCPSFATWVINCYRSNAELFVGGETLHDQRKAQHRRSSVNGDLCSGHSSPLSGKFRQRPRRLGSPTTQVRVTSWWSCVRGCHHYAKRIMWECTSLRLPRQCVKDLAGCQGAIAHRCCCAIPGYRHPLTDNDRRKTSSWRTAADWHQAIHSLNRRAKQYTSDFIWEKVDEWRYSTQQCNWEGSFKAWSPQCHLSHTRMTWHMSTWWWTHISVQVAQLLGLGHAGSWQWYWANRPHRESCCPWGHIHCRAMSVAQDMIFATSQRRSPMPCKRMLHWH